MKKKKRIRLDKVIGFAADHTSIQQDVELDDLKYWSRQPAPPLVNNYKPSKFELTETAKFLFGRSITKFVHSVMP